jgi:para-nitrobenzyl esterase
MDQIRALEWVRDNIAQFGGNPAKVMIFGQSAGASSTLALLTSPRARGLFHSAIIHSMAAFTFTLADAETKGALVEKNLGCSNDNPQQAVACMRQKSAHDVTISIGNDLTMGGEGQVFGPNVDGFVLPRTMMSLVREGRQNPVPVIVGSTADEFTTIAPLMLPYEVKTEEQYADAVTKYFSSVSTVVSPTAILAAYPSTQYASRKEAITAMVGDYVYSCPTRMLTRSLAATHHAPVRRFLYGHTFSSWGWRNYRAAHGFELVYLFGPLPWQLWLTLDESEKQLQSQMIRAWVNFAANGSPDGFDINWPTYDANLDNFLVLDTPPRLGSEFRKVQCDFWQQYEAELYP